MVVCLEIVIRDDDAETQWQCCGGHTNMGRTPDSCPDRLEVMLQALSSNGAAFR